MLDTRIKVALGDEAIYEQTVAYDLRKPFLVKAKLTSSCPQRLILKMRGVVNFFYGLGLFQCNYMHGVWGRHKYKPE
jgi:hypothetical protein